MKLVRPIKRTPSCQEQAGYLRRVFTAPGRARDLADQLVELPEMYRNLALLRIAEQEPAVVYAAIGAVRGLGCLACEHDRHDPGDCLVAMVSAEGHDGTYCLCGAPGPGPVVAVFDDEVRQVQQELADRAWDAHVDAGRQAQLEADL